MAARSAARWLGGRAEETWAAHYAALAGWAAMVTGDAEQAHRVAYAAFVRLFSRTRPDDPRVTLYRAALHELDHGSHVGLPHASRWRDRARLLALAGLTVEEASLVLHRPERALAAVFARVELEELPGASRQLGPGGDAELHEDVAQVELDGLRAEEQLARDLPVAESLPHQATDRDLLRRESRAGG